MNFSIQWYRPVRICVIILIPLLTAYSNSIAQNVEATSINGTVRDDGGQPLANASVTADGYKKGTVTDEKGHFSLSGVLVKDKISVSLVGYGTAHIVIKEKAALNIILYPLPLNMDSVQILSTGYQKIGKERAAGAFDLIDNKALNRRVSPDILSRIENIASGVVFQKDSRGNTSVNIRGVSTIQSNTDPLIVVDNFPYEGSISNINPDDVENITILKDASAASIWGARAANGVIVVTMKKGKASQHPLININSSLTVGEKPDLFYLPYMKTTDFIDMETQLFDKGMYDFQLQYPQYYLYGAVSPVILLLDKVRNNIISEADASAQINSWRNLDNRSDMTKYAYHPSVISQNNLSLSGGSPSSLYYLSAGYTSSKGALGDISDRIAINAQHTLTAIKNLSLTTGLNVTMNKSSGAVYPSDASPYPYEMLADANGHPVTNTRSYLPSFLEQTDTQGFLDWTFNPLTDARLNNKKSTLNDIRLSVDARYALGKGFSVNLSYQFQKQTTSGKNIYDVQTYMARDLVNKFTQVDADGNIISRPVPAGGVLERNEQDVLSNNGRMTLNYDLHTVNHQVTVIAGLEARQVTGEGYGVTTYGYDDALLSYHTINFDSSYLTYPSSYGSRSKIPGAPDGGSSTIDRYRSWFANASYSYHNKYTITGSARQDASNFFGVRANQRAVPLWSGGVKWTLDRESFYKWTAVPDLSIRATYGYNGNINKRLTAFTTATYGINQFNLPQLAISTPPNDRLRWERTGVFNIGIDFGIRGSRISGNVDYYRKKGLDLIAQQPIDPTTGFENYTGNVANMKSRGVDVRIATINLKRQFRWTTEFIFNYNQDKITEFFVPPSITSIVNGDYVVPVVGKPLYALYSYRWAGLDPATGDPLGWVNGTKSNNYGQLVGETLKVGDLAYNGPTRPVISGAVLNTFSFHGFSVSANISYKLHYYFRRTSINYNSIQNPNFYFSSTHKDYSARWQKPGDEQHTNVPSMVFPANSQRDEFYQNSEILVEKGDHLRWQDLRIGYDFNIRKMKVFKQLQIYGYVNNIGLLWSANRQGIDPDFQKGTPVTPRSFAVGVNASL